MSEKIVVMNKSNRRFVIGNNTEKNKPVFIGPGETAELGSDQATKLMKTYPAALFDISKMAKTQSVKDIEKGIKDRDEKIAALVAKVSELEGVLKKALAENEGNKGLAEQLKKTQEELKKLKK